ncbi:MAG: tetratricopeptide repeat protein, partial [Spirochaetes bacterium]|nr:tetratricopeptide repeat protein [Spirochaetota bacterium]
IFIISCKTTTKPIIYDKTNEKVDKEVELIRYLINNRNFEEAENQIENNLRLFPDNIDLLHMKAWLYLTQNKLEESEELFNKIIKSKDKNPLALAGLARINRIKGNKDKAIEFINRGILLQPMHSILWFEKGLIEYESKDYKRAYSDFNKSYMLDNKTYDAYFFKYITGLKMGRELDEMKYIWEDLMEKKIALSWYYQHHAAVLFERNQLDFALKIIDDGLNVFPDDSYLLNYSAFLLYEKFIINKDEELIKKAKENILKCLENSDEMSPNFVDTYLLIIEKTEDKSVLKKELDKYYMIYPNSEIILKWIKKIK